MNKIVCKCGTELNEAQDNFGTRLVGGMRYFRHVCKTCWTKYAAEHRSSKASKRRHKKRLGQVGMQRQDGAVRHIVKDSRSWDKKHGFTPDPELTKEFVEGLLQRGCQYCGATHEQVRIALDRIDNHLGHGTKNVNPACVRCNLTRGNMPYAAWLEVVPGMRRARERGLFGTWVPGNRRNPRTVIAELEAMQSGSSAFSTEREWNDVAHAGEFLWDSVQERIARSKVQGL